MQCHHMFIIVLIYHVCCNYRFFMVYITFISPWIKSKIMVQVGTNSPPCGPCGHPHALALLLLQDMSIPLPILHHNHPWGLDLYTPKIQGGRPNWIKWSCTLSINLGLNLLWHMLQIHFIFRTANWLAQENSMPLSINTTTL